MKKKTQMNSRERILAAIEHKPTDRLPVMLWIEPHCTQKLAREFFPPQPLDQKIGWSVVNFISDTFPNEDIRKAAPLVFHLYQAPYLFQLGSDATEVWASPPWKLGNKIWFEKGRFRVKDVYGITRGICGIYIETIDFPCKTPEALDNYEFPDFSHPSFYDTVRYFRKRYKDKAIMAWCPGVQDNSQGFCGLENLYTWMVEYPDVIKDFFRKHAEHSFQIIRGALKAGADVVMIGDDYGTQNNMWISKKMWEEFTYPVLKKQVALIQECGGKAMLHSCGYVEPLLDKFVEAGLDAVQPIQPSINNFPMAKKKFGKDLCFFTGIDVQRMNQQTPREVKESIRKNIETGKKGGGFVLCCTHYLQHNTPDKNIRAVLDVVREVLAPPR